MASTAESTVSPSAMLLVPCCLHQFNSQSLLQRLTPCPRRHPPRIHRRLLKHALRPARASNIPISIPGTARRQGLLACACIAGWLLTLGVLASAGVFAKSDVFPPRLLAVPLTAFATGMALMTRQASQPLGTVSHCTGVRCRMRASEL